ncbi:MAG: putative transcriptional regulator [Chthonomonadaceae bacterium]|nr:putative transcriptional regulator [Chthonomonadaceae bacterium]
MDLSTREGRRRQGARIKEAAREAGLTLDELARQIGCSRALIFQYASGASLAQSDRLQQIAAVVNRPLDWFFREEDAPDPEPGAPADTSLSAEQSALQTAREEFAAERARFEQRQVRDDIARLEALLAAYSAPVDYRKIVDCCQQLQPLLAHDADGERPASVLFKQGNALIQLQEWGAAREKLEEAAALFRQVGNPIAERDTLQSLGHANLMLGRVEEALQQFEYVASGADWTNRWQGTLSRGAAHEVLGDYAAAIADFEAALEIVEERGEAPETEPARLYVEANWSNLELDFGDYQSALLRSQRCVRMAQRRGLQSQYIEALLTGGVAALEMGDPAAAIRLVQQALDAAHLSGDQQHRSLALACLSACDSARGHLTDAIAGGKEALALALRCSAVRAEILAQRALARAYLHARNAAEALYHAQQGLAVAINIRLRLPQAQFGALKAEARIEAGQFAEARADAERALKLAEELQSRPVEWECRLVLSRAALGAGAPEEALTQGLAAEALAETLLPGQSDWRGIGLIAEAHRLAGRQEEAQAAYAEAAERLTTQRMQQSALTGEDTTLEDPRALEVWRGRLRFMAETAGWEAARELASGAEWPPLLDWFDFQLFQERDLPASPKDEGGDD